MAKKSMIQREIKRKGLVNRFIRKRQTIKQRLKDLMVNVETANIYEEKLKLQENLQKLPKNSIPIRIKNRCWKTGRSRGYYRDFGLSRHVVREMAHEGMLPGVIKASW
jgi:small subunit ribosomal protein S14